MKSFAKELAKTIIKEATAALAKAAAEETGKRLAARLVPDQKETPEDE